MIFPADSCILEALKSAGRRSFPTVTFARHHGSRRSKGPEGSCEPGPFHRRGIGAADRKGVTLTPSRASRYEGGKSRLTMG
jgi:hypothetical protein